MNIKNKNITNVLTYYHVIYQWWYTFLSLRGNGFKTCTIIFGNMLSHYKLLKAFHRTFQMKDF